MEVFPKFKQCNISFGEGQQMLLGPEIHFYFLGFKA